MKKMYLFCAMMLLTACGTTRPSTFYVLDGGVSPERSVTIKDARGILIGIEPVFVPDYLNKPQIVIRQPDVGQSRFPMFSRAFWATRFRRAWDSPQPSKLI